jgi:putative tryptophan/tyrosine transport system substrate-binding protein
MQFDQLKRRGFIMLLGGAAAAWPLAARAQQSDRVRLIVVLTSAPERSPVNQAGQAAFLQGLEQLGWSDGRNIRIEKALGGG